MTREWRIIHSFYFHCALLCRDHSGAVCQFHINWRHDLHIPDLNQIAYHMFRSTTVYCGMVPLLFSLMAIPNLCSLVSSNFSDPGSSSAFVFPTNTWTCTCFIKMVLFDFWNQFHPDPFFWLGRFCSNAPFFTTKTSSVLSRLVPPYQITASRSLRKLGQLSHIIFMLKARYCPGP